MNKSSWLVSLFLLLIHVAINDVVTEATDGRVNSLWSQHDNHRRMDSTRDNFSSQELLNVLDQICSEIQSNSNRVSLKTVQSAQTLAEVLKRTSKMEIKMVWSKVVENQNICGREAKKLKELFVDVAASVISPNSAWIPFEHLFNSISESEPSGIPLKKGQHLANLMAFASEPDADVVRQMVPPLIKKSNDSRIILSLSALIEKTRVKLDDSKFVESLYQTVLHKVSNRHFLDHETEIVRLLKALGNIKPRTKVTGQENLAKIISDKGLSESIRVAAIDALLGIEMEAESRKTVMEIFANEDESNEVRIIAYRAMVQSQITLPELRQIRTVTEDTTNEDLRNYIFSHQKNLRFSNYVTTIDLPANSPLFPQPNQDFLISKNLLFDLADANSKIGAIVDADIILESQVPKVVNLNLIVSVAEKVFPVLELSVRQHGLSIVPSVFEPFEKLFSPTQMFEMLKQVMQYKGAPQLQIQVKVEGATVLVLDSFELLEFLGQLYEVFPIEIDSDMVMIPLKHQIKLPTASGIPTKIELNATLIGSLEASFKKSNQSGAILSEMYIKPTLVGELGFGLLSDVKFEVLNNQRVNVIHRFMSSPSFNIKFMENRQDRKWMVTFLFPEREQIFAEFETELYNDKNPTMLMASFAELKDQLRRKIHFPKSRQRRQLNSASPKRPDYECLSAFEHLFGLNMCTSHYITDDLKTLNSTQKGLYRSHIRLVKTDRQMEGIEFAVWLPDFSAPEWKFQVYFDTPNSQISRKFKVKGKLIMQDQFLVEMNITAQNMSCKVRLNNENVQKRLFIELTNDIHRQFLFDANFTTLLKNDSIHQMNVSLGWQPSALSEVTNLDGAIQFSTEKNENTTKKQLILNIDKHDIFAMNFSTTGSVFKPTDMRMSTSFKLDMPDARMDGLLRLNKNYQYGTIKSIATLDYNLWTDSNIDHQIKHELEMLDVNQMWTESRKVNKLLKWNFQSTEVAQLNHQLVYRLKGDIPENFVRNFTFTWSDEDKSVKIFQEGKNRPNDDGNMMHVSELEILITPLNLDFDIKVTLDQQVDSLKNYLVEINATHQVELLLKANLQATVSLNNLLRMESEYEMTSKGSKQRFHEVVQEVATGVFQRTTLMEHNRECISRTKRWTFGGLWQDLISFEFKWWTEIKHWWKESMKYVAYNADHYLSFLLKGGCYLYDTKIVDICAKIGKYIGKVIVSHLPGDAAYVKSYRPWDKYFDE